MNSNKALSLVFRAGRDRLHMTQQQLADAAGVHLNTIRRLEHSPNSVSFGTVLNVASILGFEVFPKFNNDIKALLDEHAKCVLSDVSARLSSSLGECVEGNVYEIVADKDGSFWINHKEIGSGEPLKQWIDGVLNVH